MPVKLPLQDIPEVEKLEEHLRASASHIATLINYLQVVGGKDGPSMTNTLLKRCLTNRLATQFSFMGSRQEKRPFKNLILKSVIVDAVRRRIEDITERDVENCIKVWLKHAPQRVKLEQKKINVQVSQ